MADQKNKEFFTVVYEIEPVHHDEWWVTIQPMFLTDNKPISVISVTHGDLAERVDEMEMAAEAAANG